MKHNSPQLGFNNNVRHKGRVFHIQTEDSGIKHPHIITHLFADGGRILKSTKTSYAEFLDEEDLTKKVRGLMQEQHKAMFIALRGGKFDQLLGVETADGPVSLEGPPTIPHAAGPDSVAISKTRASMASLTGATEFAHAEGLDLAAAPAPPAPLEPQPPLENDASGVVSKSTPPSSRKAHGSLAHADTIAMPSVSDPDRPSAPHNHAATEDARGPLERRPAQTKPAEVSKPAEAPAARPRFTPVPPRPDAAPAERAPNSAALQPPARTIPNDKPMSPLRALAARKSPLAMAAVKEPSTHAPPSSSATANRPPSASFQPMKLEKPGARSPSVPPPPPDGTEPRRPAAPTPPPRPPLSASLDLDLEALERAAEQAHTPVYQQIRDLPPPPASLLKPSATPRNTSYRSVTPQATQIMADGKGGTNAPPLPPERGGPSATPPRQPAVPPTSAALRAPNSSRGSRYAPSRPASIFGGSRPNEGSIFGEDLISEKSLDEVILSYLAEDLEGGGAKK